MWNFIKRIFSKSDCPDCGWFMACDKCSTRYDDVDEQLKVVLKEKR